MTGEPASSQVIEMTFFGERSRNGRQIFSLSEGG
jgi:hypothetical protein